MWACRSVWKLQCQVRNVSIVSCRNFYQTKNFPQLSFSATVYPRQTKMIHGRDTHRLRIVFFSANVFESNQKNYLVSFSLFAPPLSFDRTNVIVVKYKHAQNTYLIQPTLKGFVRQRCLRVSIGGRDLSSHSFVCSSSKVVDGSFIDYRRNLFMSSWCFFWPSVRRLWRLSVGYEHILNRWLPMDCIRSPKVFA